jgi:dolichol-phosphate mannosyltransferase
MSKITSEKINQLHPEWEFPEFEIDEINKKKHKYCVCVFVINEGERIQKQLQPNQYIYEQ